MLFKVPYLGTFLFNWGILWVLFYIIYKDKKVIDKC